MQGLKNFLVKFTTWSHTKYAEEIGN